MKVSFVLVVCLQKMRMVGETMSQLTSMLIQSAGLLIGVIYQLFDFLKKLLYSAQIVYIIFLIWHKWNIIKWSALSVASHNVNSYI